MAMYDDVLVDMPNKGVIINDHNPKKIPYAYYATKYYRNDDGKSITERKCIGKKDVKTGKLIPNNNYYDLFDNDTLLSDNKVMIAFLELVLRPNINNSDFTVVELIKILSEIKVAKTDNGYVLDQPLTKIQEDILKCFNVTVTDFVNSIR